MKQPLKRLTALLLTLALTLGLACTNVWAASPSGVTIPTERETYINPIYQSVLTEADLTLPEDSPQTAASVTYYTSLDAAAAAVRKQLKARKATFQIGYKTKGDYTGLAKKIFDRALKHTRVPTEGDYLKFQYHWCGMELGGKLNTQTNLATLTISYSVNYMTTADQETQVTKKVKSLLSQLNLEGKSRAEKIEAIYGYICKNVRYDYDHLGDETYLAQFSAYAALLKNKAVCQGYAVLLYRLLLEEQVDCRVIPGIGTNSAGNSEPHAWNIVRIGPAYYDVDATWDASRTYSGYSYQYYLQNEKNFSGHARDADYKTSTFQKGYPMSTDSYSDAVATKLSKSHAAGHSWLKWAETAPTYTKAGSKTYACTVCGKGKRVAIDKLNAISASNVTKTTAAKAQSFTLKATAKGGTLTYKSNQSKVKVGKKTGKVTIAKKFVGKATITVTAGGSGYQTATKKVTVTVNPKGVKLVGVKNLKGKKLKVTWRKNTAATGYQIQYSTSSGFKSGNKTATVKKAKTKTVTLKGLKKGKTYYVRVRTYKTVSGKKYYSGWSGKKAAKVSK